MIKVVFDSNVLVSGLLWGGIPGRILQAARDEKVILFSSKPLLKELARVLNRRKFDRVLTRVGLSPVHALMQAVSLVRLVVPRPFAGEVVIEDPSDDLVLECAVTAAADMIVTGDEHLLDLKKFRGVPILSPAAFMKKENHS